MSAKEIQELFALPNQRNIVIGDWLDVEKYLGYTLPSDYKDLIEKYGTFNLDSFLWVYNPFTQNKSLNLINQTKVLTDILKEMIAEFRDDVPYDYPCACDLIPWSSTENGDDLYWLIDRTTNEWKITVNQARSLRNWQEFDLTTTDFLYRLVTKQIKVEAFPDSFPDEKTEINFQQ